VPFCDFTFSVPVNIYLFIRGMNRSIGQKSIIINPSDSFKSSVNSRQISFSKPIYGDVTGLIWHSRFVAI
jgi:hypothetical protein